ncbi:MAG: hypothetical protein Q7J12_07105 [Syntrophales bacterium]|nr:hypothetical protein [Syntrophales bacterium]
MNVAGDTFILRSEDVSGDVWHDWRWQYKNIIHTLPQLARVLNKPLSALGELNAVDSCYPFAITPYYLSLMDIMDKSGPLRLQCFPDQREICFSLGGVEDPLGEKRGMPVPNLLHRYHDRCLMMVTKNCFTYCRHCNRKRMWGERIPANIRENLRMMLDYVAQSPGIREVIVSGGDPLTLEDDTLDWFLGRLRAISHVEVLRVGSRVSVVLPMRIT